MSKYSAGHRAAFSRLRRYAASPLVPAIAVFALLSTSVLMPINPQSAGWLPDHGHIYRSGLPVPHTHPWEHTPQAAVRDSRHAAPDDVVFTPSQTGDGGVSVAVPLLPAAFEVPPDNSVQRGPVLLTSAHAVADVALRVPTPPPRS